jgi:hypothetical protein
MPYRCNATCLTATASPILAARFNATFLSCVFPALIHGAGCVVSIADGPGLPYRAAIGSLHVLCAPLLTSAGFVMCLTKEMQLRPT